ncbi:MAG: hypothetical protein JW395_3882 [Nitrospira sp.]|nr:hypothetical protein [Nitrospira sp.]
MADLFAKIDDDVRMGGSEGLQCFREVFRDGGSVGKDADVSCDSAGVFLQFSLEVGEFLKYQLRPMQERLSRGSEGDALADSVQELHAQRGFEFLNSDAGCGNRKVEP